jgi:hypothetical protein
MSSKAFIDRVMPCSCRVLVTGGDWAELGGRTVLAGSWTALPAGPLHQASRCQWFSPGGGGVCLLSSGTPVGFHVPLPFFTGVECTEAGCLRGGVNLKLVSVQWLVASALRKDSSGHLWDRRAAAPPWHCKGLPCAVAPIIVCVDAYNVPDAVSGQFVSMYHFNLQKQKRRCLFGSVYLVGG